MAKKQPKKIKTQSQTNYKTVNVPPLLIIDNIVISKKEAWAYYTLSEKPYDFLSYNAKINLANQTITALGSLAQTSNKRVDCHLQISNVPFNTDTWVEQIDEIYNARQSRKNLPLSRYIKEQAKDLRDMNYTKRVTYLGVKLYNRGSFDFDKINPLEMGFKEIVDTFKKVSASMFKFEAYEITAEEEQRARDIEKETFRILRNTSFQAKRPSNEELLLNIKQKFYPGMPTPYLETNNEERIDLNDIVIETGGIIDVKPRWLKINQFIDGQEYEGYRATLSFSKFPKDMGYPSQILPFYGRSEIIPYLANCRFTLVPTEEMKSELKKTQLSTDDEINNLAESGQKVNASIKETLTDLNTLEEDLEENKLPWMVGSYRVTIEASSEEELKEKITALKSAYSESDTVLTWTTGDQLNLFREDLLSGQLEISSFQQTTNLAMLGIAGINYGSQVGDTIKQQQQLHKDKYK